MCPGDPGDPCRILSKATECAPRVWEVAAVGVPCVGSPRSRARLGVPGDSLVPDTLAAALCCRRATPPAQKHTERLVGDTAQERAKKAIVQSPPKRSLKKQDPCGLAPQGESPPPAR